MHNRIKSSLLVVQSHFHFSFRNENGMGRNKSQKLFSLIFSKRRWKWKGRNSLQLVVVDFDTSLVWDCCCCHLMSKLLQTCPLFEGQQMATLMRSDFSCLYTCQWIVLTNWGLRLKKETSLTDDPQCIQCYVVEMTLDAPKHFEITTNLSLHFRTRLARPSSQDVEALPLARLAVPPGQSHGSGPVRVRALLEQLLCRPVALLEFNSTLVGQLHTG